MGKYTLVAASYDKNKNAYYDEVPIKLSGGSKNELVRIDFYTSSKSKMDILRDLKHQGFIDKQDFFSIKYENNNEKVIYYKVIFNNQNLQTSLNQLIPRKYNNRSKFALSIRYDNEYFAEEWEKLKNLIIAGKFSEIEKLYTNHNHLLFFINRYLTSVYDNELSKEKDLEEIKKEFSRYKTFRGWIIANSNKKIANYQTLPLNKVESIKIKNPISIEEAEAEYEKNIQKLYGLSYMAYQISLYNRKYLNYDQEEFLEEHEWKQMNGKIK